MAGFVSAQEPRIRALAEAGATVAEAAVQLKCSKAAIYRVAGRCEIKFIHGCTRFRRPPNERALRMVEMMKQGLTLQKVGEHFGITRERVRQIITKAGHKDARRALLDADKAECEARKAAAFEARIREKWGVPIDVWRQCRADGLVRMYESQKAHAGMRAIEWRLTFGQWLAIWQASGKLGLRGRGKGRYCMSRIKDAGGYVLGNVHIQLATENSREAVEKWRGKTKANRGVFLLYPGTSRPWCARAGKVNLGRHATEEEAAAARAAHLATLGEPA